MNTEVLIPNLTRLAFGINKAHTEVLSAKETAKEKAAVVGEMLTAVKLKLNHGEFIPWIEGNCEFDRTQAHRYVKVAQAKSCTRATFDRCTSIREVLEINKKSTPKANIPFTQDDAQTVQKLHTLAERGTTEGERRAAQSKLDAYAKPFGKTPEQLIGLAKKAAPQPVVKGGMEEAVFKLTGGLSKRPKDWLVKMLIKAVVEADDDALWAEILKEVK